MTPNSFNYCELRKTAVIDQVDGFEQISIEVPGHGLWVERQLKLPHILLAEHRVHFEKMANIEYDDSIKDAVHHCMSIEGEIEAVFNDFRIDAKLSPMTYHMLYVPQDSYSLLIGKHVHNIHLEIDSEYYASLLCDEEKWSNDLRDEILNKQLSVGRESYLTQEMLLSIHQIFNGPLTGSLKKLLIEAKIHELLALQLGHTRVDQTPCTSKRDLDSFVSLREYLQNNFLAEHSLKSLAKHFGMNEFKLKKGFREFFNTTVFDYLFDLRMNHALKLLQANYSVKEVGSLLGYSYPNHFSAAFKKRFGSRPSEFVRG